MKKVKAEEIAMGIIFAFLGWTGVHNGKMYCWSVSVLHPRIFGWVLIVFGMGIPVAAYIMRSRQNKDK